MYMDISTTRRKHNSIITNVAAILTFLTSVVKVASLFKGGLSFVLSVEDFLLAISVQGAKLGLLLSGVVGG